MSVKLTNWGTVHTGDAYTAPWFRCLLFAKLDQMHPMRSQSTSAVNRALRSLERPNEKPAPHPLA